MIQFHIPDMSCGACAQRIQRALAQAPQPVDLQVDIDVAARRVRLPSGANAQTAQAVQAAIEAAGYTAQPVVEPASPPERAGGCCCASRRAQARPAREPSSSCCA